MSLILYPDIILCTVFKTVNVRSVCMNLGLYFEELKELCAELFFAR